MISAHTRPSRYQNWKVMIPHFSDILAKLYSVSLEIIKLESLLVKPMIHKKNEYISKCVLKMLYESIKSIYLKKKGQMGGFILCNRCLIKQFLKE